MPPLNIDQINTGVSTTYLIHPAPLTSPVFWVETPTVGAALVAYCGGSGTGVLGGSNQGAGVVGQSTDGTAVDGFSNNGIGVIGGSINSYGVKGGSSSYAGVYGVSSTAEGVSGRCLNGPGVGVYGASPTTGVFGSGVGTGVEGQTTSGIGVQGISSTGTGVRGVSSSRYGKQAGVVGVGNKGARAGLFVGPVVVTTDLTVYGGLAVFGPKSAAVRLPDGSQRLLYVMESPEAWFEDFGRGKLISGRARITLDPQFAATVRTGGYHVFVMPEGNSRGLYVSARSRDGFDVREQQGGTSNVGFSYRVVARRNDIRARRFEKTSLPEARELTSAHRLSPPAKPSKQPAGPRASALPQVPRAGLAALRKARRRLGRGSKTSRITRREAR